jgi:tetratricopeptide (TPR) repeat protein
MQLFPRSRFGSPPVTLAVALAISITGGVAATVATAAPPMSGAQVVDACAVPNALLAAGEKAEARKSYVAILRRAPATSCAREALAKLNATQPAPTCDAADALFDGGDLSGARAGYSRLRGAACATAGLDAVRQVDAACAQGRAEARLGHDSEARKAYESALAKSPNVSCAKTGLSRLDRLSFTEVIDGVPMWAPRILAAIGLLLVGFFLLLLAGYIPPVGRWLLKVPVARSILGPRLSLSALDDSSHTDDKIGASIAARIKEQLQRFRDEAFASELDDYDVDHDSGNEDFFDIVTGNGAVKDAISSARDISDQTKTVAAFLDLLYGLLPIRKITVDGVLEAADGSEACMTLTLQDGAQQQGAVTLTAPTKGKGAPKSSDYARLAKPAAVWVNYEVTRLIRGDRTAPPEGAASYALLREGVDRENDNQDAEAEQAYVEAILLNRANWAARANLAILRARRLGQPGDAIATVRDAYKDMRSGVGS